MPSSSHPSFHHRLDLFIQHIPAYCFDGGVKLAKDAGISSSAVYHLLHGRSTPSYRVAFGITEAISKRLGRDLSPAEIFSFTGAFPTPSVCDLAGCQGCLPDKAFNPDGSRKSEYRHLRGGEWHLAHQVKLPEPCPTCAGRGTVSGDDAPDLQSQNHNQGGLHV